MAENDATFAKWAQEHRLEPDTIDEPTWEGANASGKLDYLLSSGIEYATGGEPAIDELHDICTDHKAIIATLHQKHGTRPKEKRVHHPPRLRLDNLEELAHVYSAKVDELLNPIEQATLEQAREAMWAAALDTVGLQEQPSWKPPHQDPELCAFPSVAPPLY